jgi:hypothetical protein
VSVTTTHARPARRPSGRPAGRPRISVVRTQRRRAPRAPFVALVLVLLPAGLGVLLILNTLLAQGSFTVRDLSIKAAALQDQQQALQQKVSELASPARLQQQAAALGMVPTVNPAFIRLSDGKILGDPVPAAAPVVSSPPTTNSAAATSQKANQQSSQSTSGQKSGTATSQPPKTTNDQPGNASGGNNQATGNGGGQGSGGGGGNG